MVTTDNCNVYIKFILHVRYAVVKQLVQQGEVVRVY